MTVLLGLGEENLLKAQFINIFDINNQTDYVISLPIFLFNHLIYFLLFKCIFVF